jgi:NADH dehydrogenase
MQEVNTVAKKILIIGNGFGGVYALKDLHKNFHHRGHSKTPIELTLIGENNYFLFTPLPENIIEPVHKVLACGLDTFYQGKAKEINPEAQTVRVGDATLSYDYLILASGAETNFYGIPGAEQYSLPLKSLEHAITIKNRIITKMEEASRLTDRELRKKMLSFVVVGGGPAGVEISAELAEFIKDTFARYYSKEVIEDASVTLIQRQSELLAQFGQKIRSKSLDVLTKKGVKVLLNTEVSEVSADSVIINKIETISTQTVIWVAGVKPTMPKFTIAIATVPDGRLIVNEFLQLTNHPEIFVLGDLAASLPQLAQVAVKQARFVAESLTLACDGKSLKPFVYKNTGSLVSLGEWMAIGEIGNFTFWGHITWWIWRTVYLSKLISWQKKVKVAIDWTIGIFSPRDISKL